MTVTVLVPDDEGFAAVSARDGLRPVRYDSLDDLPPEAAHAQVLIPGFISRGDSGLLDRLPRLRLVQLLTTGADAWSGTLPDHVLLSTCRGAHGGSTAEWVVAALLTLYREMREFDAARREGRWDAHVTDTMQDKRILIVGAGDLGSGLRRRLDGFDAQVTVVASSARPGVHGPEDLPGLLPHHDVVVLVVPLTTATRGMADAGFLAAMPDGAILVNAARGPVVDTDALLAELTRGRLRAALDVTDPEPLPADHPLWTAPGLVLTPHVAGSCAGHRRRAYRVAVDQIARFAAGEQPTNLLLGEY